MSIAIVERPRPVAAPSARPVAKADAVTPQADALVLSADARPAMTRARPQAREVEAFLRKAGTIAGIVACGVLTTACGVAIAMTAGSLAPFVIGAILLADVCIGMLAWGVAKTPVVVK